LDTGVICVNIMLVNVLLAEDCSPGVQNMGLVWAVGAGSVIALSDREPKCKCLGCSISLPPRVLDSVLLQLIVRLPSGRLDSSYNHS